MLDEFVVKNDIPILISTVNNEHLLLRVFRI